MANFLVKTGFQSKPYKLNFAHESEDLEEAIVVLVNCDSCVTKENRVSATSFCSDCQKYLCRQCSAEHASSKDFQGHTVCQLKKKNTSGVKKKLVVDFCEIHKFSALEFYCKKHADVFCIHCKTRHLHCPEVSLVRDLAKGIKSSKELPRTMQEIRQMIMDFEKLRSFREDNISKLEQQKTECLKSIHALRKQANSVLDQLEDKLHEEMNALFESEVKEISDYVTQCGSYTASLEEELAKLEHIKSSEDHQVFVSLTKASVTSKEMGSALHEMSKETKNKKIEFEQNFKLKHFLTEIDNLGHIKTVTIRPKSALMSHVRPTSSLKPMFDRDMILTGEHTVVSPDDKTDSCSVSASAFLADGRLLLCDNKNSNIKLLNQTYQLKSTMMLPPNPVDLAIVSHREAAITIPAKKQIVFATVDPMLKGRRTITTSESCYGIAFFKGELYVSCYNYGVYGIVQVLQMDGQVTRYIDRDHAGNAIFQGPYFLTLNPATERIYIGDKVKNTVCCLTLGGKVVFRFRNSKLEGAGQMTLDRDGNVYVCGRDSNNIHLLSRDGKKRRLALEEDNLAPRSISYRDSDKSFVLSRQTGNTVYVYKTV